MSTAKKSRTPNRSPQVRQIEFTPGQMIIAICTLIVFGLVCFMLGVLVNKLDSSVAPDVAAITETEAAPGPATAQDTPAPRTQQTSPLPPESLRGGVASRNQTADRPDPSQPRTVAPPSANRRAEAPEPTPRPALPVSPEPPAPPVLEPPVDEPIEEASASPEPESPDPTPAPEGRVLENADLLTLDEPEQPASTPGPSAPAAGETAYGVQVASVSAEREEQARRALADAERVANHKGQLVPSDDGRMLRLVVGSFADRAEATRLMESMRQHRQYESCFVQTFTQSR